MGNKSAKCALECAPVKSFECYLPQPVTTPKFDPHHVDVPVETDEFISQYGSHFSSTYASSSASSSSSAEYSENTDQTFLSISSSYSKSESSYSDTHSHSCSTSMDKTPIPRSISTIRKCKADECEPLARVITALQWHASVQTGQTTMFKRSEYTPNDVADDYQHLLMEHLFEMDGIKARVNQFVATCDTNTCGAHKRYLELCSIDVLQCDIDDMQFYLNVLDLIHCYLFHSKCSK
eukprot:501239_1